MHGKYETLYRELKRERQMIAKAPKSLLNEEFFLKRREEIDLLLKEILEVKRSLAKRKA